jgi:glycosyltransferase involved in cell wall biosynthesis
MPFFSVIIPLYNKENFIKNTLQSVLNQTFFDFEIIIINDGSTDQSENIVLEFQDPRIRYYVQKNQGVSVARNYGIRLAQSKYITFIDADDFWYPNFLASMHQTIHRFPEQKVFAAAIEIETPKNIFPAAYSIQKTSDFEEVNYFEASSKESVIWTSCSIFHRLVFEKVGNFDITIKSGQDTDLWIRIGLIYPVLFSWKILARYVYDSNSLSKNKNYTHTKINFSKFSLLEKTNPDLKKFLDLNRFSLAIKSKLIQDKDNFTLLYQSIDLKNLNPKKRILLLLPAFILRKLIIVKQLLADQGLGNSVFK